MSVSSSSFFGNWAGHPVGDLQVVYPALRGSGRSVVWLAGDSSLDNKHWVLGSGGLREPAFNGYEEVLRPKLMAPDVAFWVNTHLVERRQNAVCLNTSIEESTLAERKSTLLPQDEFIRDHIAADDVLIVSVGGNDIALRPSFQTAIKAFWLSRFTWTSTLEKSTPCGLGHLIRMFRDDVRSYVERLVAKTKPRQVIVCMIYHPQIARPPGGSWADTALGALGYNKNPGKVQLVIRRLFELATSEIRVPGTTVVPLPLFHGSIMDGSNPADYVARVEPSSAGGRKMAAAFVHTILTGAAPQLGLPLGAPAAGEGAAGAGAAAAATGEPGKEEAHRDPPAA